MTEIILTTFTRNELKTLFREAYQEFISEQYRQAGISTSDLMTARQAADYLNMAMQTLYGYVNRNQIPYLKRGRLYFRKADLDQWLSANS